MHLKVSLNNHQNFTRKELEKLQSCLYLLQKAVNSEEFKERLCKIEKFTDSKLNGKKVYEIFMQGRQLHENSDDYEMDIDLTIYHSNNGTIGYTYPSTFRTWINRKFFLAFTLSGVCGNISHEYCHKLGFVHSRWKWPSRKHSVPYAVGYLLEDICKKIEKKELAA